MIDTDFFFGQARMVTENADRFLSWDQFELRQGSERRAAGHSSVNQTKPNLQSVLQVAAEKTLAG